jgi:hypothetical protein
MAKQDSLVRAKEKDLSALISYDAETGEFVRLVGGGNGVKAGDRAGYIQSRGYVAMNVGGKQYLAHRLAWRLTHGDWPKADIDHINGDKTDNRLCNLRDVNRQTNTENVRKARTNSASGLLGAYFNKKKAKWFASITTSGRSKFLGHFETAEAAHRAYMAAKPQFHAGFVL